MAVDLGKPGRPFDRNAPFFRGFLLGLGLLTAGTIGWAVLNISGALIQILVAFFIAAGLSPVVRWFERRGLRRGWAVLCVTLLAVIGLAIFLVALVPVIIDQIGALTRNAPHWLDQLEHQEKIQELDEAYGIIEKIKDAITDTDFVSAAFGGVLGVSLKIVSFLFSAFLVIVMTLYFLASYEQIKKAIYSLAPASRRERVTKLGDQVLDGVGGYVAGAFVVAVCAGTFTLIMLFAVGLGQYAVALAFVVALLDVIPMIGATLGSIVVSAIGLTHGITTAIVCLLLFQAYQQVENYLIYPNVMKRNVNVPSVVTIIAALVGSALLGIVGALLAIPVAAAVLLLVRELIVRPQDQR